MIRKRKTLVRSLCYCEFGEGTKLSSAFHTKKAFIFCVSFMFVMVFRSSTFSLKKNTCEVVVSAEPFEHRRMGLNDHKNIAVERSRAVLVLEIEQGSATCIAIAAKLCNSQYLNCIILHGDAFAALTRSRNFCPSVSRIWLKIKKKKVFTEIWRDSKLSWRTKKEKKALHQNLKGFVPELGWRPKKGLHHNLALSSAVTATFSSYHPDTNP